MLLGLTIPRSPRGEASAAKFVFINARSHRLKQNQENRQYKYNGESKSYVSDQTVSFPMTFSDLERSLEQRSRAFALRS